MAIYSIHVIGILLITCLVIYSWVIYYKEGFSDVSVLIQEEANNTNPLGIALIASNAIGALGSNTAALTGTPGTSDSTYTLNAQPTGVFKKISTCEAVTTADCSAFDNPAFQTDCGICLDIGSTANPAVNSRKVAGVGGRLVLANTRATPEANAKNGALPAYQPMFGTCPAKRLVTTKAQCLSVQRNMACEKSASFGLPGCVQCLSDSTYSIVDPAVTPGVITGPGTLHLAGEGNLSVAFANGDRSNITLSHASQPVILKGLTMAPFYMDIQSPGNIPMPTMNISGYLSGTTASGKFTIDLHRIVQLDQMSGGKPRTEGKTTLDGIDATVLAPAYGQNRMYLNAQSPFTFVEPTSQEASRCPSSPFVTTEAAANFLDTDPCYKKGTGPGTFKMECLQNLFISNGCTQKGKGYPSNAVAAGNIMTNADGTSKSLNAIANYVYAQAMITATGLLNGQDVAQADWSAASVFCTGNIVDSPCDTKTKDKGPLSAKCLASLWNNQGGKARGIGSTYGWSSGTSLVSKGTNAAVNKEPTFCTVNGLLSPILPNGQPNTGPATFPDGTKIPNVVAWWQQQGGVTEVRTQMNLLYTRANSSTLNDSERSNVMSMCYGYTKIAPDIPANTSGCKYPSSSDNGGLCSTVPPFSPQPNKKVGTVNIGSGNYTLSFTITPKGLVSNWASLMHVTNGADCCSFGTRAPGIWFYPGTTALHIRIGDSTEGNWGLDKSVACPMNVATPVSIVANGHSVTITVGTTVYNLTQPTRRPTGNGFTVYMADPWYPTMNATISNFSYVVDGVPFIPRL